MMGLCQLALARIGLEVGSDQRQWAHSASCAAVMVDLRQLVVQLAHLVSGGWR
jgi:hypothetical protein